MEDIEDALDISFAETDDLRVDDCRRLTGPGLLWDRPGAVVDVFFDGFDTDAVTGCWQRHARTVLDGVGWHDEQSTERRFEGGVNLAISAPMDQLYSAVFAAQTAWHFCAAELLRQHPGDLAAMIDDLKSVMAREANPALISLMRAAAARNIDVLSDDDELSLGHGTGSMTWPVSDLPSPRNVDWGDLHNIPIALITGTNGKTTTTRLCAAIARASGKVSGLTSTEFIRVGDDILDRGDYSGPGGARMLLRDKRLQIACLEVARGGILRRGLPAREATVALVTNVAADHLGQYGINTVAELAKVKFAVQHSLGKDGVLVLNADDPFVVAEAALTEARIWWFSLDADAPQIVSSVAAGLPCSWMEGDQLQFYDGVETTAIVEVNDIPITMDGAARYNISNALGAACASRALGLDYDVIRQGLTGFRNDPSDNPGRCNEFAVSGARVFVDFAHNPHSIAAVTAAMAAIPAKRRFVLLSHAGDRSDKDIRDVTTSALALHPDFVVAAELEDYLRGRSLTEVPNLIAETCKTHGLTSDQIIRAGSPSDGVARILEMIEPGDLALLLVLSERERVFEMLGK